MLIRAALMKSGGRREAAREPIKISGLIGEKVRLITAEEMSGAAVCAQQQQQLELYPTVKMYTRTFILDVDRSINEYCNLSVTKV